MQQQQQRRRRRRHVVRDTPPIIPRPADDLVLKSQGLDFRRILFSKTGAAGLTSPLAFAVRVLKTWDRDGVGNEGHWYELGLLLIFLCFKLQVRSQELDCLVNVSVFELLICSSDQHPVQVSMPNFAAASAFRGAFQSRPLSGHRCGVRTSLLLKVYRLMTFNFQQQPM